MKKEFNQIFIPAIFFLLFAIFCRFQAFGNPLLNIDESFYLFSGGRILAGDLPYVSFWDRKPIFLFLLYAVFHLFGTYSIIAYQIGALIAVWATCLLLFYMARTITSRNGALVSGLLYCVGLSLCGGESGQSPVFYTLLVAAAMALVLFKVILAPDGAQHVRKTGLYAMGLFGISMQIKYTTVFEGVFLGSYLLWYDFCNGRRIRGLLFDILLWVIPAILPTAAVFAYYALIGHGNDWFFANLESIFLRGTITGVEKHSLEVTILKRVFPLIAGAIASIWLLRTAPQKQARQFISMWAFFACGGILVLGCRYDHYFLPAFAPLALVNCVLWNFKWGRYWLVMLLLLGSYKAQKHIHTRILESGDISTYHALLNAMSDQKGCLFIYDGSTTFYDAGHWCALTRYPFPAHFNEISELNSTGMDTFSELKHILSQNPEYIMIQKNTDYEDNGHLREYVTKELNAKYGKIYEYQNSSKTTFIYKIQSKF